MSKNVKFSNVEQINDTTWGNHDTCQGYLVDVEYEAENEKKSVLAYTQIDYWENGPETGAWMSQFKDGVTREQIRNAPQTKERYAVKDIDDLFISEEDEKNNEIDQYIRKVNEMLAWETNPNAKRWYEKFDRTFLFDKIIDEQQVEIDLNDGKNKSDIIKEGNVKVLLAPTYESAKELTEKLDSDNINYNTVEAEYGAKYVEGKSHTLAHHLPQFQNNPAPCMEPNLQEPMKDGVIIVSHLDLDTIGGVLALMGQKSEDKDFWKAAEFIDVHGIHHLHELGSKEQEQLNGYYCWGDSQPRERYSDVKDVTEKVAEHADIIDKVIGKDKELIQNGDKWAKEMEEKTEKCLIAEDDYTRVFMTDKVFCSASYYSPKQEKVMPSTVVLNTAAKAITVAFADGGKNVSARELVQNLWGEKAGGHPGIAGSPRGEWNDLGSDDLKENLSKAVNAVENKLRAKENEKETVKFNPTAITKLNIQDKAQAI